ncbi:Na/Pi cotransporter family protein [bacterium]|nr:Na/Pi cotransporter family protein [bacterium]
MDIFSIFTLCGGLAFFLYGMNVMSSGLEKVAGGRLEKMLKAMTSNPFKSLALGAGITIAIQSSSALTVMLVGLVNSGIMELGQTIGVIMGSNVGTTLTAWILSLSGIESSNFFLRLLKPESFSPIIALIGIIMMMSAKRDKTKSIGSILIGFAVLMYGMQMMSDTMKPLADMPEFTKILTAFANPIIGVIIGAIFTGVIQSSAASVGVLQALSLTGEITFGMAIPIIMGQNIGTCVTALISSIGVGTNAKRVSAVHVTFNVIGTIVFLTVFYIGNFIFGFKFLHDSINPVNIALCHTIFNVATTVMLLPFIKQIEKIAIFLVKSKTEKDEETVFLDDLLLKIPSFAIGECKVIADRMGIMAKKNFFRSIKMINNFSEKRMEKIMRKEPRIDMYEDKLGTFLVKLSNKNLTDKDSHEISKLLHSISDFERIGDHAINILKVAQEMNEKQITFSDDAKNELKAVVNALSEIMDITMEAFCENDIEKAKKVEPLEQVIDILIATAKNNHVERLQKGQCTIELGFMLTEVLNNIERVSDHCSNVAVCIIQLEQSSFDRHKYLNTLKNSGEEEFKENFEFYKNKYIEQQGITV